MKKEVGNRIRKLRQSKDYSQENMALELNISTSAYSKIERGMTDPSVGRLAEIAKILDVDVTYFLQEAFSVNMAEEKKPYGTSVSREEVTELSRQIKDILREMNTLKKQVAEMTSTKKASKK